MIKEKLEMRCDGCGKDLRSRVTTVIIRAYGHTALAQLAEQEGWYVDGFEDLCPRCQPKHQEPRGKHDQD